MKSQKEIHNMENLKKFVVTAKCGHVGKNYYTIKKFAIMAENKSDAAQITRFIPRVKHHHKDAIIEVIEVDDMAFNKQLAINNDDPYFKVSNKQEQNMQCEELEVYEEKLIETLKSNRRDSINYRIRKIRIIEKYFERMIHNYA